MTSVLSKTDCVLCAGLTMTASMGDPGDRGRWFLRGVLVGRMGGRMPLCKDHDAIFEEEMHGAAVGAAIAEKQRGQAPQ